jgi:hypothetical protein
MIGKATMRLFLNREWLAGQKCAIAAAKARRRVAVSDRIVVMGGILCTRFEDEFY